MHYKAIKYIQPKHHTILRHALVVLAIISLNGCVTNERRSVDYVTEHYNNYDDSGHSSYSRQPSATGFNEYYYYPEQHVYLNIHRHVYHYYHRDQGWLTVSHLPSHIKLSRRHNKALKYRHNRPWDEAHEHKRHRVHRGESQRHTPRHNSIQRDKQSKQIRNAGHKQQQAVKHTKRKKNKEHKKRHDSKTSHITQHQARNQVDTVQQRNRSHSKLITRNTSHNQSSKRKNSVITKRKTKTTEQQQVGQRRKSQHQREQTSAASKYQQSKSLEKLRTRSASHEQRKIRKDSAKEKRQARRQAKAIEQQQNKRREKRQRAQYSDVSEAEQDPSQESLLTRVEWREYRRAHHIKRSAK